VHLRHACGALRPGPLRVLSFGHAHFAFFFLLARLEEIDAAVINEDNAQGLLRWLQILEPFPVVAYSGRELERGARIVSCLSPRAGACGEGMLIAAQSATGGSCDDGRYLRHS
jgi:hypothetical protein